MPDVTAPIAETPGSPPARGEKLALLYQGILTAIVRIQSGKYPSDYTLFRRQMENLLDEIEREAIKVGYRNADIQDAHYTVIAFLNECIQRTNDPNRTRFTPLMAKSYQQAIAGEKVFERLKEIRMRRDSAELADLLDVYLLCFLLGYEGQYGTSDRSELDRVIEDLRAQIERIRGRLGRLSPEGDLPVNVRAIAAPKAPDRLWRTVALCCIGFALASWIVFKLILGAYSQGVIRDIMP